MFNAEVEAVDAAEEVEGVVDDAWAEEPDAEVELDPDVGLEACLANFIGLIEGRRLTWTLNQTTLMQSHWHWHYHWHSQTLSTTKADKLTGLETEKLNGVPISARSSVCETIKERAKHTQQGSEDVCQEVVMGPVEVMVSVRLLIGEGGGEHWVEGKGWGKEGKAAWPRGRGSYVKMF
ncbi:hypothetical protein EDD85DRAFT_794352 [Armillaria nabsnona]|nr:hypothetical protein EDD85DRAFT_794352 [Armillaria nabsnona]